jgi:hypothetical protein
MNNMNVRAYVLSLWLIFDPIYYALTRLTYLEEKESVIPCAFRVRVTKYKGRQIILSDGTIINKNDKLIKIHLHNVRLLKEMKDISNEYKRARYIYSRVRESMPQLATYILNHNDCDNIKGIIGITMLNKGTKRLGFEVYPIKNKLYRSIKKLTVLPIHILSCKHSLLKINQQKVPDYLMMSKDQLTKRYTWR